MDHHDHVRLIRDGVDRAGGGRWADLGAGGGAFTLALADLLGPGATLIAIDRDAAALRENAQRVQAAYPATTIEPVVLDFADAATLARALPPGSLDGVVMANSLHFVRRKLPVVRSVATTVRPGGRFVLVEYDADTGNPWVPWPMAYPTWARLAAAAGLLDTRRIAVVPSRFLGSIYAAVSSVPVAVPNLTAVADR